MTYLKGYRVCNICGEKTEGHQRIEAWSESPLMGLTSGKGTSWDLCKKHFKEALKKLRFILH